MREERRRKSEAYRRKNAFYEARLDRYREREGDRLASSAQSSRSGGGAGGFVVRRNRTSPLAASRRSGKDDGGDRRSRSQRNRSSMRTADLERLAGNGIVA